MIKGFVLKEIFYSEHLDVFSKKSRWSNKMRSRAAGVVWSDFFSSFFVKLDNILRNLEKKLSKNSKVKDRKWRCKSLHFPSNESRMSLFF